MAEATGPQLVPVAIEDEMRQAYLDYSMSVIVGRALPDVRDGLKPVHRRILYAMFDQGMLHNKRYSKCAGTVGEVLKKYHPHGDAAVYDALVRLAQEWNLRAPLVDGQGNFGSIDGDSAAAYRYTEARLTRLAEFMLGWGAGGNLGNENGENLMTNSFAAFIQDDWRISPRLTINLGLRYDIYFAPTFPEKRELFIEQRLQP